MPFIESASLPEKEIVPGFRARCIHTDHLTVAFWEIDEGAVMPEHKHPHEQVVTLLEGRLELMVEGDTRVLRKGSSAVIPANALHSGKAVTACRTIDVFYPARDDYR